MARLDGYVANMEYVHNYYRDMNPYSFNFVLARQAKLENVTFWEASFNDLAGLQQRLGVI